MIDYDELRRLAHLMAKLFDGQNVSWLSKDELKMAKALKRWQALYIQDSGSIYVPED
jgi:hypothetical protein